MDCSVKLSLEESGVCIVIDLELSLRKMYVMVKHEGVYLLSLINYEIQLISCYSSGSPSTSDLSLGTPCGPAPPDLLRNRFRQSHVFGSGTSVSIFAMNSSF